MHFSVNYEREIDDPKSGPVKVGWFLANDEAGVLYDPPERLTMRGTQKGHAKSAGRCPAIIGMETRYFIVKCPFDIHIAFGRDKDGKPILKNKAGTASTIRAGKLGKVLHMTSESEWRFPDRPTIQLSLPYTFISDETVYITQLDAFAHYRKNPLPGTIFGGRFPINIWPRALMWAFEWHDIEKELILRRGDPLFYVQFEADSPDRPIQMMEAEKTPELERYLKHIGAAVNYVNQTFSLFKAAERVRPKELLTRRKTRDD